MEQRWNVRAEVTRNPRENQPTNCIVQHDSHIRKSGSNPVGYRILLSGVVIEITSVMSLALKCEYQSVARIMNKVARGKVCLGKLLPCSKTLTVPRSEATQRRYASGTGTKLRGAGICHWMVDKETVGPLRVCLTIEQSFLLEVCRDRPERIGYLRYVARAGAGCARHEATILDFLFPALSFWSHNCHLEEKGKRWNERACGNKGDRHVALCQSGRRTTRRNRPYAILHILQQRSSHGSCHCLSRELRADEGKFLCYFRRSVSTFEELLGYLQNTLRRQDTNFFNAITPAEMLAATIILTLEKICPWSIFVYASYTKEFGSPICCEPFLEDAFLFEDAHQVTNLRFRVAQVPPFHVSVQFSKQVVVFRDFGLHASGRMNGRIILVDKFLQ
ncbi:hypothetical protein PR048_016058 [Dryococelus australis]|uniref:Uncharacterized protein n=1 Tax=Dryococelus australis TaxID=614101 RepID=A0ABQ9HIN8_9NEOP|nr:hypothetical protein PR048_016058 [Dryococelus australis]